MSAATRAAAARISRIADRYWPHGSYGEKLTDPVECADVQTSLADARAALCIACGVPVEDIDPASGHDLTRGAYERSRSSWRWNAAMHGITEDGELTGWYARAHRELFGYWAARRPEFTDGGDRYSALVEVADLLILNPRKGPGA